MGRTCGTDEGKSIQDVGGEFERNRTLGRPTYIWKDSIKTDVHQIGWGGAWIGLIWLRIGTVDGLL
jgi:hypothetical protein